MKKSFICVLLAVVMIFSAAQGMICGIAESIPEKETPVAKIENDNYVPYNYENRNNDGDIINSLNSEIESMGGYVEKYSSEEEYQRAQKSASSSAADYSLAESQIESVKQTFTVMTTPTGSKEHGNYVESKPVANAIVRLDGVPRYTDRNGQIKVTLNREYVELYVEKEGYNPYIEIIEPTGEEKVINLKKPSDDIDIYAVMFTFVNEAYNLLIQNYNCAIDYMDYHADLIVLANVVPDYSILKVNGKPCRTVAGNDFIFFDYNSYNVGDKFSIQIIYEGILSKEYELNFKIIYIDNVFDDIINNLEISLINDDEKSVGVTVPDNKDFGTIKSFDFDIMDLVDAIKTQLEIAKRSMLSPKKVTKLFKDNEWSPKFMASYKPQKGTIEVMLGISYSHSSVSEEIKGYNNALSERNKRQADIERLKEKQRETESKLNSLVPTDWSEADKNQLQRSIEDLRKDFPGQSDEVYKNAELALKEANDKKLKDNNAAIEAAKELCNTDLNKINNEIKNLKNFIKNPLKTYSTLNSSLTWGFEFYATLTFDINNFKEKINGSNSFHNAFDKLLTDFNLTIGVEVKAVIKKQFMVWVIPVYLRAEAGIGVKVSLYLKKEGIWRLKSFEDFFKTFVFELKMYVRGDAGAGLYSIASVGGFVKLQFDAKLPVENFKEDAELDIKLGVGIRAKLLLLSYEHEWYLYEGSLLKNSKKSGYKMLARNLEQNHLSDNQIFGNCYQESKPQLVDLGDNKSLLIWIADEAANDTYNRTVLKYAVSCNGIWSESYAVMENSGYADFYPNVYNDGESVYLTWQRCNKKFTEKDDLTDMAKAGEIMYAKFDSVSNKFINIQQITSNDEMDLAPQFAVKEKSCDTLSIVWQKNSKNDILGLDGINYIYSSSLINGKWTEPKEEYSSLNILAHVTAGIKDGSLIVAFVEDFDNDFMTETDRRIIKVNNYDIKTVDIGTVANPQFVLIDNVVRLFYAVDGCVVSTDDFIEYKKEIEGINQEFALGFNIISGETGLAIVYEANGENGRQGYVAVYDKTSGIWGKNALLVSENLNIYSPNGYFDESGCLRFSYTLVTDDDKAAICYGVKSFNYQFEIKNIYTLESISLNNEAVLRISLINTGDYALNRFSFSMFGQSVDLFIEELLYPGEEETYFVNFLPISAFGNEEEIFIDAYSGKNLVATNSYKFFWNYTDLTLDYSVQILNCKQIISVRLENKEYVSTNFVFTVYKNSEVVKTFSGWIEGYASTQFDFSFEEIDLGDFVFCEVVADSPENHLTNNCFSYISIIDETKAGVNIVNPYEVSLWEAKNIS